ncbi:MAG: CHAT domain-containing protein [Desulfobacteraceae bacterium]|jgi:hypothetical protein
MVKQALFVHPLAHSEIAENINDWLNEACSESGDIFILNPERYQEWAEMRIMKENYDLLVSHLNIPYNKSTSMQSQQMNKNGLKLLEKFRHHTLNAPVLIISPIADNMSYGDLKHFEPADLIIDGIDLEQNFKSAIKRFFSGTETDQMEEADKIAYVDIGILSGNRKSYYRIRGESFPYEDEGALVFPIKGIKKLGEMSDDIADKSKQKKMQWRTHLTRLGEEIRKQLFAEANKNFLKSYSNVMGLIDNKKENFRFRFVVEQDTHNIIFEALMGDDNDFIMLHSPVHRRLAVPSHCYALFQDLDDKDRNLNCLVIRADVSGIVRELSLELDTISNVDQEIKFWNEDLRADKSLNIKVIDKPENGMSYFDTVRYYLEKINQNWDIVHFAGHSAYINIDEDNKEGYLFFPGEKEGKIRPVSLELFAGLLYKANVKLVYLSSCHSSEKGFVFEMVKRNVPAAVGFRWDIEDEMAEKFTRKFYRYLLKRKSLEVAFLETRKDLYFSENNNSIWAAAMLVVQI